MENICKSEHYDVIVIGGGHAGTEAALAAARMGAKTLLLTHNIETIGQMSCNPAIGGIGKGHLVKEIDALGGVMGRAIDMAGIHYRTLNSSKGPAVRATRAQADRNEYRSAIRNFVEHQENLFLFQQAVDDLLLAGEKVVGAITQSGIKFYAETVVLTAGTFLAGKIHIGKTSCSAGRAGDPASRSLAESLRKLPFRFGRLKTGTPPRIDARTVDCAKLEQQPGDAGAEELGFSFWGRSKPLLPQICCYIAYTNEKTHQIIRDNLTSSAMYSGLINGIGPRYCPSIEDKIIKFADKDRHQVFIEPEGLDSVEMYPNGMSTSLPFAVQQEFIRSMCGLENAHLVRPGYAVEYDFFDPRDLFSTLESKIIENLFFAGQINGTTGYEEAGAQGLLAGLNAARKVAGKSQWYPRRDEAYLGVLVDDLVVQGTEEPYRMFTSRAEYRLMLREDNADLRLCAKAIELGLLSAEQARIFNSKQQQLKQELQRIQTILIRPDTELAVAFERKFGQKLNREYRVPELLKRPDVTYQKLFSLPGMEQPTGILPVVIEQVEIQVKYEGYIAKQAEEVARSLRVECKELPLDIDYDAVTGLSNEDREKLKRVRPKTLGQAGRISGVTPAAVSLLLVYLKKYEKAE